MTKWQKWTKETKKKKKIQEKTADLLGWDAREHQQGLTLSANECLKPVCRSVMKMILGFGRHSAHSTQNQVSFWKRRDRSILGHLRQRKRRKRKRKRRKTNPNSAGAPNRSWCFLLRATGGNGQKLIACISHSERTKQAKTHPCAISSRVNVDSRSMSSCRYKQSGLVQGIPRKKFAQYFVVPNETLSRQLSSTVPSTAWMA